jgi:IS30 family transposase
MRVRASTILGRSSKTLTFDNGREFSWHEKLAENLDCNTYFAKPYHSWERGLNENHNGLLAKLVILLIIPIYAKSLN